MGCHHLLVGTVVVSGCTGGALVRGTGRRRPPRAVSTGAGPLPANLPRDDLRGGSRRAPGPRRGGGPGGAGRSSPLGCSAVTIATNSASNTAWSTAGPPSITTRGSGAGSLPRPRRGVSPRPCASSSTSTVMTNTPPVDTLTGFSVLATICEISTTVVGDFRAINPEIRRRGRGRAPRGRSRVAAARCPVRRARCPARGAPGRAPQWWRRAASAPRRGRRADRGSSRR